MISSLIEHDLSENLEVVAPSGATTADDAANVSPEISIIEN
jgi:hypothetical protein